jgi:hypothetical protein
MNNRQFLGDINNYHLLKKKPLFVNFLITSLENV